MIYGLSGQSRSSKGRGETGVRVGKTSGVVVAGAVARYVSVGSGAASKDGTWKGEKDRQARRVNKSSAQKRRMR
jgi:hypothetical protein